MDDALSRSASLLSLVAADLDARLDRHAAAPIVVAVSGGGDSLALLLAAKAWADGAGRRLIAMTVDHRLQPQGAAWARWCQERASRLGLSHRTLVWEGSKPAAGLAAAARQARHGLLADAARDAGAGVVLMGHTADDRLEAAAMRAAGSTVGEPRTWSPSPVWPQGRGIFLLRPLLTVRRAELRRRLAALGEAWIDDPANLDPHSARARARARLALPGGAIAYAVLHPPPLFAGEGDPGGVEGAAATGSAPETAYDTMPSSKDRAPSLAPSTASRSPSPAAQGRIRCGAEPLRRHLLAICDCPALPGEASATGSRHRRPEGHGPSRTGAGPGPAALVAHAAVNRAGHIAVSRAALAGAPRPDTRAFLAAAMLCAAGSSRPPRGRGLDRIVALATGEGPFAATLAGAEIRGDQETVRFRREPGRRRAGPILASAEANLGRLVWARLAAACGAIGCEAAIGRVAETARAP